MVVGNGMLARAFAEFREDDRVLVFASGVSNSLETDRAAFEREKSQLLETREAHPDKLFVYFGTCSADDPDRRRTPYVLHKLEAESMVERIDMPWMVLRLPLAIGPGRRSSLTLAPYLHERISRGERFEVWQHASRYPIDVEDVVRIARRLMSERDYWNRRINIALRAYPVLEFVRVMEAIVGKPARYDIVPKGRHYPIRCPEVEALAQALELDYGERYLERVLRKYFAGDSRC